MKPLNTKTNSTASQRQRGFTLIEMLIAVALLGILGALVTTSALQSRKSQIVTTSKINVADQVARASLWLSRDGHNAVSSDLVDGAAAVSSVTLDTSSNGVPLTCTYTLANSSIVRSCGGSAAVIARHVSGLSFSKAGNLISASFSVAVGAEAQSVAMKIFEGGW